METQIKNCKWSSADGGKCISEGGGGGLYITRFNAALTAVFKSSPFKIKVSENVSRLGRFAK